MEMNRMHIGVDISKDKLDVFIPSQDNTTEGKLEQLDNKTEGYRKLRDTARKYDAIICMEPTGGHEYNIISYMHKVKVEVAFVDAMRARRFAEAKGRFAKNDKLDAKLIAEFADKIEVKILSGAHLRSSGNRASVG